jgi:hypothetical protein
VLTEIDLSVEVNLDIEPPCEFSYHQKLNSVDPAKYLLDASCPGCGDTLKFLICETCYQSGMGGMMECYCGHVDEPIFFWKVVSVL